jgi:hypothetical protein
VPIVQQGEALLERVGLVAERTLRTEEGEIAVAALINRWLGDKA